MPPRKRLKKVTSPTDFDHQLRERLSLVRDRFFQEDWWPRQGGQDEALLIALGMGEFIQGVEEEEDRMARGWQGLGRGGDLNTQTAKIWLDEGKGVLCSRFPYNQLVIGEFKEKIPKGKKAWNPEDKLWEFSVETIDVVVDILTRHFDEVIDLTQTVSPSSVAMSGDQLLSLLDKEDIQGIYRLLAKKYHPDKQGGDGDKMAKINQILGQVR